MDLVALSRSADNRALRDMAVFDAVVNNADRKIGHLLPVSDGRLYGCDHGVCFGEEYKLRTVLWQWRGRKLPGRALAGAGPAARPSWPTGSLAAELPQRLTADEIDGHQAAGRPAARAGRAPVPAGGLARRPLAAVSSGASPGSPGSPRRRR